MILTIKERTLYRSADFVKGGFYLSNNIVLVAHGPNSATVVESPDKRAIGSGWNYCESTPPMWTKVEIVELIVEPS